MRQDLDVQCLFSRQRRRFKRSKEVDIAQILQVIATDIGTKKDFPAFADRTGHEIVEMVEEADKIIWYIRRTK